MAVDTGHYPYKYDEAVAAGTPVEVANACLGVVDTQHAYLEDPTEDNAAAYNAAVAVATSVSVKYGSKDGTLIVATNGSGA